MYSKKGLLAIALVLCLFETVLSIKCYSCMSTSDGDCYNNPKEADKTDCSDFISTGSASLNSLASAIRTQLNLAAAAVNDGLECGTYTGLHAPSNKTAIVRTCTHKSFSCDSMKVILSSTNIKINSCFNCTTDYCNSSSSIQAGAFILGFSLLLTLLFSDKL